MDKTKLRHQILSGIPVFPHFPPNRVRSVEGLVYPSVQMLDVTGPLQEFASANDFIREAGGAEPCALRVVAQGGRGVVASAGLGLAAEPLPPGDAATDTLVVAGGPGVEAAAADIELVGRIRAHARRARRVASVCAGAFLLATSGVLDARRATTHWSLCADLARRLPSIRVEPDPIFVRDGPVWTSAGVTAGIDLALALVEQDLGRGAALSVARYLVVFLKRPGGQAQFSTALSAQSEEDKFGALHDWISGHLGENLSLGTLARWAAMSERSFSRHYAAATGLTPGRAVEQLRVEAARRLLADSRLPVKRIAARCGFGSEETMRRSFQRLLAATPQEYRARFGR
jgi:transcriptional regulator GlxA family with amidase domain